jgi:hypothetical protein
MLLSIFVSIIISLTGMQAASQQVNRSATVAADSQTINHTVSNNPLLIERALKGYKAGLKHPVEGVVESSIYQSMVMAIRVPNADMRDIKAELKELSVVHPSRSIRIRAFLALEFFTDEKFRESFTQALVVKSDEEQAESVFRSIGDRLMAKANDRVNR